MIKGKLLFSVIVDCPNCTETINVGEQMYNLINIGFDIKLHSINVQCTCCGDEFNVDEIEFESEYE